MSSALRSAHAALADVLGADAEPLEVLIVAEAHREFWRPSAPRVLLLAESHVYTAAAELQHRLRDSLALPPGTPRGFVRLVYSLGYDEEQLLDKPIDAPRNSGTPQYWRIFASCATSIGGHVLCAPLQVLHTPDAIDRLAAKLRVLTALRDRGIWLVDASVAALYVPGRAKPAPRVRQAALQASWDLYTRHVVAAAAPAAFLCIGVGVVRSLRNRLDALGLPWAGVPQPQARLTAEAHAAIHRTYSAVCADPRQIALVAPVT